MKKIKFICIVFSFFIPFQFSYALEEISKLFPQNNEVAHWIRSGDIRTFSDDKLWEYIDGGAESYYLYGFQKVVTCDYKNQNKQIVVDIYQMKDPKNTYGIYAYERDPRYNFIKVGVQGYLEGTALNFWKGNYYIKITTFDKSADTKSALTAFGKTIEKKIQGNFSEPAFLSYFPKNNLIANSTKYFSKDILGHSFLFNGFTADFKDGKNKYRIFLIDAGNEKSAQNFFFQFKNFLNQSKSFDKEIKNLGTGAFAGKDAGRKVFCFYNSKVMGATVGLDDETKAIKILQEIAKK